MPVRLRLQRHGRSKRPFYFIVAADAKARRDGNFIERVGDYNPLTIPATINLNVERALYWVQVGAEPTNTVNKILTFKGVNYKKHLLRGVKKGAFSLEEAEVKFNEWVSEKDTKTQNRIEKIAKSKSDLAFQRAEAEKTKREAKKVVQEEVAEPTEEVTEETTEVVAEATEAVADTDVAPQTDAPQAESASEESPAE